MDEQQAPLFPAIHADEIVGMLAEEEERTRDEETRQKRLAVLWLESQAAAAAVATVQEELREQIARHFKHKLEGQLSTKLDGITVTTEGRINYRLDRKGWEDVKEQFPPELRPIKIKEEPDPKGIKWLKENRPDLYSVFAQVLTITPGKLGVTVKKTA